MSAALRTDGLTRRFGARTAVDRVSLRVEEGDIYGFLGPNGAGKTTAIRCILGLIRRDAGEVRIFGEAHPVRQRRGVGAVVETPAFHPGLSGRANLRRAAAYAGAPAEDVERVLALTGLADRAGDRVRAYSLGMRQRLGIARALLGRPRLLVLDEPTNGLDPRGMHDVRRLLARLAAEEGLTVFISSHLLAEVQQLCNRVGILHRGRLVAEGAVDALLSGLGEGRAVEVEVTARDPERARAVAEGLAGVTVLPAGAGRLRLRLDGLDAAELNRALVEAGVAVSALVPVEHSLEDLFLRLTGAEEAS